MPRVEISGPARSDLELIHSYIAEDDLAIADNFVLELSDKFKLLSRNPSMGRRRDNLVPALRSFPHGSYVVFYFPTDYGVEIFRVLHGARDIESIFDR